MIIYTSYLFFIVRFMKILKLLPTMLLLNCVVPSHEATALETTPDNVALYLSSNPDFFRISLEEFKDKISHRINEPLFEDEIEDFETNYFNEEYKGLQRNVWGFEEFLQQGKDKQNHDQSLKELQDAYKSIVMGINIDLGLGVYLCARIKFFADSIAKTILRDEIKLNDDQVNGNVYYRFKEKNRGTILESLIDHDYTEQAINKIFFLMDYSANVCNEFIPDQIDSWREHICVFTNNLLKTFTR